MAKLKSTRIYGKLTVDQKARLGSESTVDDNEILHEGKKASQDEAEAGTDNDNYMTPLRVAQAIQELAGEAGPTIYEGDEEPDNAVGSDGDLYLMWEGE